MKSSIAFFLIGNPYMHTAINQIIQQFFRKDSLEQVSEEELRQFVADYPYATVGHLLLAKKESDSGNDSEETLRDTALYINNPLWLQWILDDSKFREQKDLIIHERPPEASATDPMTGIDTEADAETSIQESTEFQKNKIEEPETIHVNETAESPSEVQEAEKYRESEAEANDTGSTASEVGKEEMPVFQSYHTIDYFASQGIRLHPADLGKDKLGQQLRSFTDWLRSMKKLPQTATGEEDPSEQTVRVIAEHSIEEREVLTEAMAEVWAKQGNRQKASEIYRKLSLLNPAKSAYFAAKIDQL
jgi:hypothetical protein